MFPPSPARQDIEIPPAPTHLQGLCEVKTQVRHSHGLMDSPGGAENGDGWPPVLREQSHLRPCQKRHPLTHCGHWGGSEAKVQTAAWWPDTSTQLQGA